MASPAGETPTQVAVAGTNSKEKIKTDDGATIKQTKVSTTLSSFFQMLVYANPTWIDILLLVAGTIAAIASGVPFPLMGIVFGQLLDDMNKTGCDASGAANTSTSSLTSDEIQDAINEKVITITWIACIAFALIYAYTVSWSIFSRRLENRLRDRYFRNMLRQDAGFFDRRQAGELASRLNADIQAVQSGASEKVGICIASVSFFLTAYIVSFIKVTKLAGMLVSLIPAFTIAAAFGSFFTQKYSIAMSDAIAGASSIAQETLSHIAVVQAFSAGPRLEAKFALRMGEAQRQGIKKAMAAAIQAGSLYLIAYCANALAYWQGSRIITETDPADPNGTTVGEVYTVIFLLVDACIILGSIAPILPLLGAGAASFQKLREDIETPSAIDSSSDSGERLPDAVRGSVAFHGVSFAYVSRPDQPVLKNVTFECPAGKHTALVGLSGSGKSTVAGLTARLYDPTRGIVTLDGQDVRGLNVRNLRSHMSLVQQEPSLLDRSILENIALGLINSPRESHGRLQDIILGSALSEVAAKVREGHDLNDVVQAHGPEAKEVIGLVRHAASLADASGFIEKLENQYGTVVGAGGKLVSGGQRQRIALARALIRDPKILILDEATASLDSASELRIQAAIESIAKDRTLIAIAHRLSTIKNADNIIVMNNGEVIEQGTHAQLMELDGSYAGMVRLQSIESKDNDDTPSITSTARGDTEGYSSEKDLILDEKPVPLDKSISTPKQENNMSQHQEAEEAGLDSNQSTWFILKVIGRMVRPDSLWIFVSIVGATIVGCMYCASALIFGNTIGRMSPCSTKDEILWLGMFFGGMFFMLAVVEFLAYSTSWSGFGLVAEKLLFKFRVLSFRSIYTQGLEWHQTGGRTPTSILSVITADAAAVGGFSGSILGNMFSLCVNFLFAIILSHIVAWKIAIVCLVTVPILLGSGLMQMRSLAKWERRHAESFANALGISVEAVNSAKTISSLSLEQEVLSTYRRSLKAPRREMVMASVYTNFWLAVANSCGNLIYAFAYWWGSTRITKGENTQTEFFIILVAMLVSAQLWGQMFSLAPEITRARAAASRILSLIDIRSSKDDPIARLEVGPSVTKEKDVEATAEAMTKPNPSSKGSTITFKDVKFSYPARPHVNVLQNMSFTIQAGQFCGLVGPSGAGKSTIMALVQRMYVPTSGSVEIDGVDIFSREGTDFRDEIAVVPQDCALFEGTIKFNVSLGGRAGQEVSDAEIEAACHLANIHETIMALPAKYETECGPNGSRLSGGQRQRLAIARALVRKPRLLLLDESTSALDAESERLLQEGLEQAARGITVIAITHRLHTVRKADVIFVVEGGKVVEKGRHEELVERSESYRVNALQQMLGS